MPQSNIVVPLDGSELSEGALPYAAALAKALDAGLLLVTVWEGAQELLITELPGLTEDLFERGERHYEQYLAGVARRIEAQGVRVEAQVLLGSAVDKVLELVGERDARMLALASHGRSGISRWVYGSVASRLVREAHVPTLVVGPRVLERKAGQPAPRRVLLPLDGSALAESAIGPADEIAAALQAELVLAEVVSTAAQAFVFGVPDQNLAMLDQQLMEAAEAYLQSVRERLPAGRKVETKALRGPPADALMELVESERIDLVVMATHGRGGVVRLALGSVADRMIQSAAPVLMIRPEMK